MRRRELLGCFPFFSASGLPPQPDLANLHETAEWIASQNPRQHSFLDARWKSLEAW